MMEKIDFAEWPTCNLLKDVLVYPVSIWQQKVYFLSFGIDNSFWELQIFL